MSLQLGSGAGLGFVTGYAVKKIFQAIMIIIGFFFMALFGLATTGAVTVQWDKIYGVADTGVGKVADYLVGTGSIAMAHFPITAGFGLGFVYALKR